MSKPYTKEERLKLHAIMEDYLEILTTRSELREENPEYWNQVVDQWEIIKRQLESDEWEKIKKTCHNYDEEELEDVQS